MFFLENGFPSSLVNHDDGQGKNIVDMETNGGKI